MKKIIALMLIALSAFSLFSCSDDEETGTTTASDVSEAESTTQINLSLSDGISRGVIDGNVFTNETTGIRFVKPDSWVFSSDEDIEAMMNIGTAQLDRDIYEKALSEMSAFYDMVAIDPDTSASVAIAYENIEFSDKDISTEEKYLEAVKEQLLSTSMEFTFESKIKTEKLNSFTYKKLEAVNTSSGYSIKQTIYARVMGDYMCTITISNIDKNQLSKIEAMFA